MRVLVTGATGYVGSRLVPVLLARGYEVVCLVRSPEKLATREWAGSVDVVKGDLTERDTLDPATAGVDVAYYLVHSMGREKDFGSAEARSASNFSDAAAEAGIRHVVYLGGLGSDDALSPHLLSRQEVGRVLRSGPVPVTELRAAVVIGSGSLSFEMLRYLTEVLPVMTTPRWVRSRCQPIGIGDLLEILVAAADVRRDGGRVVEIGGPDVVTYEEMMRLYAREAGLARRFILPLPVLSPGLSSLWVGLVTPLPPTVARPLIGSLRHDVVVQRGGVGGFAGITRTPLREAIGKALASLETTPGDASADDAALPLDSDPAWAGGKEFVDRRVVGSQSSDRDLARTFMRIGGRNGYFTADWAWAIRGLFDRAAGGPGLRRGRRHPELLEEGDALDFWRVARVAPGRRLLLEAEMKMPGRAWLEFVAEPSPGGSRLSQTAYFRPRGLLGRLYWAMMWPAHRVIFGRMARKIARSAEAA